MLVLVVFCTFATRNGDVEVLNKYDDYGIKKSTLIWVLLLSYQDSNLDKLIQSQMCYRYTIGQFRFFLLKSGAKVLCFFECSKFFLNYFLFHCFCDC